MATSIKLHVDDVTIGVLAKCAETKHTYTPVVLEDHSKRWLCVDAASPKYMHVCQNKEKSVELVV